MPVIYAFNLSPITRFDPAEIRSAVTESNFHTLCDQYGLDPVLIGPAITNLEIQVASQIKVPFFALRYAPESRAPIIVNHWEEADWVSTVVHTSLSIAPISARDHLNKTRDVFAIELSGEQSQDMGLIFGYELARWAAYKGQGIILALDGLWYRLNAHKAFLQME